MGCEEVTGNIRHIHRPALGTKQLGWHLLFKGRLEDTERPGFESLL